MHHVSAVLCAVFRMMVRCDVCVSVCVCVWIGTIRRRAHFRTGHTLNDDDEEKKNTQNFRFTVFFFHESFLSIWIFIFVYLLADF